MRGRGEKRVERVPEVGTDQHAANLGYKRLGGRRSLPERLPMNRLLRSNAECKLDYWDRVSFLVPSLVLSGPHWSPEPVPD